MAKKRQCSFVSWGCFAKKATCSFKMQCGFHSSRVAANQVFVNAILIARIQTIQSCNVLWRCVTPDRLTPMTGSHTNLCRVCFLQYVFWLVTCSLCVKLLLFLHMIHYKNYKNLSFTRFFLVCMRLEEMVYPDRIGSRFALPKSNASAHKWFYYPEMKMEECLMFSCTLTARLFLARATRRSKYRTPM